MPGQRPSGSQGFRVWTTPGRPHRFAPVGLLLRGVEASQTGAILDASVITKVSLEDSAAVPVTWLRRELKEFFAAKPSIYWLDFLGSMALFYLCFVIAALLPWRNPAKYLVLLAA